ncbi:hypothetical protein FV218_15270 [Methylobacterium sp. WL69]|uniref:hypothetical protein n=1 Tax=Methylobacterium sp. WL69 TaxID=2603893 RepID=UPI0011C6F1C0|nr:hypothetical protein [Methylobacterium sp. WL69]TXM71391.1 hypothetical protein FV218_15270 [Methylobacterium sp. WL69]
MSVVDEIVRSAVSRLGVVRVSSALNPLLYLALVVVPGSWLCAWIFLEDPVLRYGFSGFGALFALGFLGHYTRFAIKDPDRLQSEEHLARMEELAIIERKGRKGSEIVRLPHGDPPGLEQEPPPVIRGVDDR